MLARRSHSSVTTRTYLVPNTAVQHTKMQEYETSMVSFPHLSGEPSTSLHSFEPRVPKSHRCPRARPGTMHHDASVHSIQYPPTQSTETDCGIPCSRHQHNDITAQSSHKRFERRCERWDNDGSLDRDASGAEISRES